MPYSGTVCWLGIRPARLAAVRAVTSIEIDCEHSIPGDHYQGPAGSVRQVTLIQQEHIDAVGKIMRKTVTPDLLRRNIVVAGINLQALKKRKFTIGSATLLGSGNCHPCSRMEDNLGPGGYNAMIGHGGITATVVNSGRVSVGDAVTVCPEE